MGEVWKALDTKLNRYIALKVLPTSLTADPERRRRFLREARAAAAVTHPNIVTVHEIDEANGVTFIIMELVHGKTLRTLIGGRPLPISEALRLSVEMAQGLACAHQGGIVHRDLKPENVIIASNGHPRILDFGLSKLVQQDQSFPTKVSEQLGVTEVVTHDGMILGTAAYMSPEQARGEVVDARSDLFSFGVMLYEMVTGRNPFRCDNKVETLAAILHLHAVPASRLKPEVPGSLDDLLRKCLEKDPENRYQNSQDLAVDLRRLSRDLESTNSAHYGEVIAQSRSTWRRAIPIGAGAVLLLGGVLFVVQFSREAPPRPPPVHALSAIAVLPFVNLSAQESHAYFSSALQDELLTQLARVASLKVISRTSVMGYQGTTKSLKAIASELGVGSMVQGSVQVVGERLRVNVQLIDATTDEHLWVERYDRTLDDAFAIQSEVAQQIVAAVGAALSAADQGRLAAAPTANAEAYRLYLQGRDYYLRPGPLRSDRESAQQLYEKALILDPNFALAHAGLSIVHAQMYGMGYDPSPARAARELAEVEIALRLDPDLPEAHKAMAHVHFNRRAYRRALDEVAIAFKGLPSDSELSWWIGVVQRQLGNWSEALAAYESGLQINPRDANLHFILGGPTNLCLRRYADAVRAYDRALSLAPDLHDAAIHRAWTYVLWQGQLDTLRAALGRLPKDAEFVATSVASERAQLHLLERNTEGLLQMFETVGPDAFVGPGVARRSLYLAWACRLHGDRTTARRAFDSALMALDSALVESPDDWLLHAYRGLALAGLGRHEAALNEARWLQASSLYRDDPWQGQALAENRASILAQAGDSEAALDEIELLLTRPAALSVHTLRLDPLWDPIREDPRFQALLTKYAM